jgi:hypothetical protein
MRNLSIEDGLVKNARVQVVSLQPNVVQVRLLQQGAIRRRAPDAGQADFLPPADQLRVGWPRAGLGPGFWARARGPGLT